MTGPAAPFQPSYPLGVYPDLEPFFEWVRLRPSVIHVDGFNMTNVAAPAKTNEEIVRAGGRFNAMQGGVVAGVSVISSAARTAGSLTVEVWRNRGLAGATGSGIGLLTTLDATFTDRNFRIDPQRIYRFREGDELYLAVTTNGWTPTSAGIFCALQVWLSV